MKRTQRTIDEAFGMKKKKVPGLVAVAKYYPGNGMPFMKGFKPILIHVKGSHLGASLSPYTMRNDQGMLLENIWQFSKLYECVTPQKIPMSRWQKDHIIWEHPGEVHLKDGEPTKEYWKWREKGMNNQYAVRYPNGFHGRKKCKFSLFLNESTGEYERLSYIESRKKIYCAEYARMVRDNNDFIQLKNIIENGQNIMIIEVDGPDPKLNYAPYDRINTDNPGLVMDENTVKLLINDERKPFWAWIHYCSTIAGW